MFSAYVVVGEPPTDVATTVRDAVGEDRPAEHRVEVALGHRADRLHVAGVLRDEGDDRRQHQQREVEAEVRRGEVRQPEPVGLARRRVKSMRSCVTRLAAADRRDRGDLAADRVEQPGEQVAEDQAQQDGDAGPEAAQHQRADDDEGHRGRRDPLVLRPVDVGDDRGQVEPDQHDDRAGDGRRQDAVHHARAEEVDDQADERQDDAGDQDRADDVGRVAALRADRDDAADERGAGAQVARDLPVHDQQEDDRRDPAHHDREVRVQAHDDREDEGRAEHGDDVLRADADGARPRQPLVRAPRPRPSAGSCRPRRASS